MFRNFNKIIIIGLGLIGSSIAAKIKDKITDTVIYGIDTNERSIKKALKLKFIDTEMKIADLSSAGTFKETLIILSTPVSSFEQYFKIIKNSKFQGIITDTASTKENIIKMANKIFGKNNNFIPGHPMSGSEIQGIDGNNKNLFEKAYWILTPDKNTDPVLFSKLHSFLIKLGAIPITVDPNDHDKEVAIISHLPHISAAMLCVLAGKHAGKNNELLRLSSGGFKDTTRIAGGDAKLWAGIIEDNKKIISDVLKEYALNIKDFNKALQANDKKEIEKKLKMAKKLRESIPKKQVANLSELIKYRIPMDNKPGIIAKITGMAGKLDINIMSIEIDHKTNQNADLIIGINKGGKTKDFFKVLKEKGYKVK
jgi:prephenate dehydrogenase